MIDTETLYKKILDLAIQGKLTQQLPEDGNAEELYAQLQKEKAKLIVEGKIKKEKPLSGISEDEIPFEIPSNWKWTRIGDVTYSHGQKKPQNTFCYVDVGTLDNINHKLNDKENIIDAKEAPSRARKIIEEGDVIYSTVRPYLHNICIIDKKFSYEPIASTAFAIMHAFDGCLLNKFLFIWLLSERFDKYANGGNSKGVLYPAIGEKDFFNGLLPMPPYKEQERIVTIVDDIFAQIDIIDSLQKQYDSDLGVLKGKIIDAGMRGKLTEQLSEDGNAEDLYAQIQEEKTKLIKEGKLKKEKPLPEISDDEIPFEIPDNWMWVRVGSIFNVGTGMTPIKSESRFYVNGKIPWVNSALTSNRYIDKVDTLITDYALENTSLRLYPEHTLIVAMYGEGKTRGQISELLIPATINQACAALVSYKYREEMTRYVYYCFWFNYKRIREKAGGTSQPNLSVQKIKETIIPLPPLCEQKRIVEVIERIHKII